MSVYIVWLQNNNRGLRNEGIIRKSTRGISCRLYNDDDAMMDGYYTPETKHSRSFVAHDSGWEMTELSSLAFTLRVAWVVADDDDDSLIYCTKAANNNIVGSSTEFYISCCLFRVLLEGAS